MCERRGYAILIQGGDPEISDALADGMLAARGNDLSSPSGANCHEEAGRTTNWAEVARLVKVAVGNTKTAEDYMILRMAAEQEYRTPRRRALYKERERLLAVYAMICLRIRDYFNWEGAKWRGR